MTLRDEQHGVFFAMVVVFGPPLPGRSALARTLESHLPSARRMPAPHSRLPTAAVEAAVKACEVPVVEGDFASADERAAARLEMHSRGFGVLFVAWLCDPEEARREVYERYASLPARYADRWWNLFVDDQARRDALGEEIPPTELVAVGARGSLLDAAVRVASALGLPGAMASPPRPPRRVLVVDDEDDQRTILAEALEALGCSVQRAANQAEAIAVADTVPLDVVVTDQQMPGGSGLDLATELTRRHPGVRIVLLTGHADETVTDALATVGVDLLLAKPARMADLIRLLDELDDVKPDLE